LNAFEQAGLKVVGLTYDKPEAQQPFKDKYSMAYPILSDNNDWLNDWFGDATAHKNFQSKWFLMAKVFHTYLNRVRLLLP
jgi:peroxiredoxin